MPEVKDQPSADSGTFFIRLLCDFEPALGGEHLMLQLHAVDESIKALGNEETLVYVNERYGMESIAGRPGAAVFVCAVEILDRKELEAALEQTWDWPEAASIIDNCQHAILVNDMMGHALSSRDRLENLQKVVAAVLRLVPVKAVHWPTSGRIVNPQIMIEAFDQGQYDRIANGAVNVRLYNVGGTQNELLMDTIGMEYLSHPDFQCYFKDLPTGDVAGILYGCAEYLFDKDVEIENGDTIEGCDGLAWHCSWEQSLAEPRRNVIDLHPGQFAAGQR